MVNQEIYIPTPGELGHARFGQLVFNSGPNRCAALDMLLYVFGVTKADLAKMTGLTRVRLGQYENGEPIPLARQHQFANILSGIVEAWEENLAALVERPEEFEAGLCRETLPLARTIVKLCRRVISEFEKRSAMRAA